MQKDKLKIDGISSIRILGLSGTGRPGRPGRKQIWWDNVQHHPIGWDIVGRGHLDNVPDRPCPDYIFRTLFHTSTEAPEEAQVPEDKAPEEAQAA